MREDVGMGVVGCEQDEIDRMQGRQVVNVGANRSVQWRGDEIMSW